MKRAIVVKSELVGMNREFMKMIPIMEYKGKRKVFAGFGWVDVGESDGSEPLLIVDSQEEFEKESKIEEMRGKIGFYHG